MDLEEQARAMTPEAALAELAAGNRRFSEGHPDYGLQSAHRVELASVQYPFAVILGCSDSRVPVETVFDRPAGDLFVIRVAGNFIDEYGLASLEYGVAVLGARLVYVLGHSSCGALTAAVNFLEEGVRAPGTIQCLVDRLTPIARATRREVGWVDAAVRHNVCETVAEILSSSSIVAEAVAAKKLKVVGGTYDLASGRVERLAG